MNRTLALAGTVLLAAMLAGCGGKDGSSPSPSSARSSGRGARELKFQLTDEGCTPANARVQAGPVHVVASNPASTKTDEIELKNADGIVMAERENLAPGLSADFTLDLRPGTYVLNCTFQNDQRDNGRIVVIGATT
jgi:iron uptake system component EfeO